jgi:DNA-directed RNA polymerase specialized sigma24 family protein
LDITTWTNQNYTKLLASAKNISYNNDLSHELLHYSLEQLLLKPNIHDIINSGGAEFYIIRIMLNQWRSTTSPFYRIYRKNECQIDLDSYLSRNDVADEPESDSQDRTDEIKSELCNLPWYERKLFELYSEEGYTISSLARETGIPRTSLSLSINRVKKHLKEKLKT